MKLSQYDGTADDIHGDIYAVGTVISPQRKLQFFSGKDWNDIDQNWRVR